MSDASVLVLAGPSGVGKGTVVAELLATHPSVWLSVSATTRAPRVGEIEGVHYYFLSSDEFTELVDNDGMLEWAWVHSKDRYGTPREPVAQRVAAGQPVILEIDLQGARQVRDSLPEAKFVFLAPPSHEALKNRLRGRGTESEEQIARRLATAEVELSAISEFDQIVVNDTIEQAVAELSLILGLVH